VNKHVRDLLNRWDTLMTGETMHDAVMQTRYEAEGLSEADEAVLELLDLEAKRGW
jgi:hypothetical protein